MVAVVAATCLQLLRRLQELQLCERLLLLQLPHVAQPCRRCSMAAPGAEDQFAVISVCASPAGTAASADSVAPAVSAGDGMFALVVRAAGVGCHQ